MPASTQAQQMAAGAELARRRKGKRPRTFKSMSTEKLRHYASTPRKGLPYRAESSHKRRRAEVAKVRMRS